MSVLTPVVTARRDSGLVDAPVLVLLHGYGSHERDLLPLIDLDGIDLLAPRAPLAAGPGFAWVPITVPGRPDPAPVQTATSALLAWLDAEVAPGRRVVLLGFSQGGLMVTQLLRAQPGRFVAGIVLSGFSLVGEQPGDAALAADPPPVLFARGDADAVIALDASERTSTWLAAHSRLVERVYPGMPHTVGAAERADVREFIEQVLTG